MNDGINHSYGEIHCLHISVHAHQYEMDVLLRYDPEYENSVGFEWRRAGKTVLHVANLLQLQFSTCGLHRDPEHKLFAASTRF
jgi:hypothetical protein